MDEGDDEPVRFWRYLMSALGAASDAVSPAPLDALLAPGLGPLDLAIPMLLNELTAATAPHVLVIDDVPVLRNAEVHEQLEYLLAYLPSSTQLILGRHEMRGSRDARSLPYCTSIIYDRVSAALP